MRNLNQTKTIIQLKIAEKKVRNVTIIVIIYESRSKNEIKLCRFIHELFDDRIVSMEF